MTKVIVSLPNSMFDNCTVKQTNVNVTNLPAGTKITLSVAAMVNDTEEGDYVTTVNHTGNSGCSRRLLDVDQ